MSDTEKQPPAAEPILQKESMPESPETTDLEISNSVGITGQNDSIDKEIKVASPPPSTENTIVKEIEIARESPAPPETVPEENDENVLDFEHEPVNDGTSKALQIEMKEEKSSEAEEDGLCTPEKKIKQETKDDGECSDGGDEDLEDGEINEENEEKKDGANSKPSTTKILCRFYSKGQCYFGSNCRFQHINTASGNYSMFAPSIPVPRVNDYYTHGMMTHRTSGPLPPRSTGSDFLPPATACSQPALEESASAWEKGLETARQLVRKANKRKIEEGPDYSEKSLNLSLIVNEKNVHLDSDTNYKPLKKRRDVQFPKYDEPFLETYENYETKNSYRQGFDNFDVRYHREDRRGADRSRDRIERDPRDKREFRPKSPPRSKERFRGYDRSEEVEPPRRDYTYFDPWRRSKSPKGTARRSRSRSYSSVSSYSWSDKSFSSNSYSRSSRSSSRSPPPHQKRKPSPTITNPPFVPSPGPLLTNTFTTKKKPEGRGGGGVSSSRSRTPSISRSRSFSRSISMSSVSSASSRDSLSHSSGGSISRRQNSTSILRKQDENPTLPVGKTIDPLKVSGPSPAAVPLPSMYLNYPLREREKELIQDIESPVLEESERDPLEEKFLAADNEPLPFPSLQHLLPTCDKVKEPLKVAPHKQQIKLTLLNKNPHKMILPKKELDNNEPSKSAGFYFGVKGPLSPPTPPVVAKPTPVLIPKKSASSRRDELLKQLKAVEDAIARKRAKFG